MISRLKTQHLLVAVLLLLFVVVNGQPISDTDTWWHLKTGEYIFQSGDIPHTDIFSYSNSNHPWITHEWAAELLYYLAHKYGGFSGLFLLNLILLGTIFYFYYHTIKLRGRGNMPAAAIPLLAGAFFTFFFWVFRPHMFSHLLFIVFLYVLARFYEGRDFLWLLPILMVFWVNAHGSFIMGPVLICLYLIAGLFKLNIPRVEVRVWSPAQKRKLWVILGVSTLATLMNPNTYEILLYPFQTINSSFITDQINEWASPDFHEPYLLLYLGYMFLLFTLMIISEKQHRLIDLILVGMGALMSFYAIRNVALYTFIAGPVMAYYLTDIFKSREIKELPVANWLLFLAVTIGIISAWPSGGQVDKHADNKSLPVAAVQFMEGVNLRGKIFNDYNWGGYLLWTNYPKWRVMVDGRTDVYADKVFPDYLKIYTLRPGAELLLNEYSPDIVLIKRGTPLETYLVRHEHWQRVYSDELAVIFTRKGA